LRKERKMEPATTPDYPRGITFEQVWAALMEDRERQKEIDRLLKETDRIVKEVAELQKETDRQLKETDRRLKETNRQMGDLHNRFGELAEHLVAPGILRRFNELDYHFKFGVSSKHGPFGALTLFDEQNRVIAEIDVLLVGKECLMAVEVKTRPVMKDIAHHIKRLKLFRGHKDWINDKRKIRGAIAGAVFPQEVKKAVIEAGFFVIEQSGDTMKICVPEDFVPRDW
jgi:hypothetical protein